MLLGFQVLILPPIVYEAAINVEKRSRVITRLGTIALSQILESVLFIPLLTAVVLLLKVEMPMEYMILLGLSLQLNDYAGTLDSHVIFNIANDDTLSFLGSLQLFRNSVLLFLLVNLMPESKSDSQTAGGQIAYGLYQFIIPTLCALLIFIPTTFVLK